MESLLSIFSFSGLGGTVLAFFVALSVIVAVHEYGHYIVGRWSGIEADVFSIGFGPVIMSWVDSRGTRWQFAAIPLGGYVKFRGDSDAASAQHNPDIKHLTPQERRATMAGAPLWARAATVAAGPMFNFIFSIFVFALLFLNSGAIKTPLTLDKIHPLPVAHALAENDVIRAIEGRPIADLDSLNFDGALRELSRRNTLIYEIARGGDVLQLEGPFPFPARVAGIAPKSAASQAGLEQNDVITHIDGKPIVDFDSLKSYVEASQGATLTLDIWRRGQDLRISLAPRRVDVPTSDGGFETQWRVGIVGGWFFEPKTESVGIFDALWGGALRVLSIIDGSLSGLYHMITGAISSCNISGPIGIAEASGDMARQGTESFIGFVAVLSAAIGLMNLFPIPILDGGHLVLYAYEGLFRRPPSERVTRVLMGTGFAFLISLMLFALGNDLFCP